MNPNQNRNFQGRPAVHRSNDGEVVPSQTEIGRAELEEVRVSVATITSVQHLSSTVQELKNTQFQNSELRKRVRELQDQVMELQVQVSGKPKEIENNEKAITSSGRRFCIMNEPFFPENENALQVSPANMNTIVNDAFNPITRYATPASQLQGFVAELYHELPTNLRDAMRHSKTLALVRSRLCLFLNDAKRLY